MRLEYKNVDCAILNTGAIRVNREIQPGTISYSLIVEIFSFTDMIVVK